MAEGKGFRVIVKINLPPEENYHSGHSIIVQGDTVGEVRDQIAQIIDPMEAPSVNAFDQAQFILLRFAEFALGGAAQQALTSEAAAKADPVESGRETPTAPDTASDLASEAVLKAVAKKTGKSVEELGELTTADAQKLLKKEVKK